MNPKKYLLISLSIILLSAFAVKSSMNWQIDEGYSIEFAGTDAEGIFKDLQGDIQFDAENPENSSFSFTVDVNTINTGNGMKNKHAVSPKWFDADQFPQIKFQSSSVSKKDDGYEVTGTMEIHGVQKEMTIPFMFADNTFTSSFSVKRMDFGVGTMKGMSKKVSDNIDLKVSVPVKQ